MISEAKVKMKKGGVGTLEQAFSIIFKRDTKKGLYTLTKCFQNPKVTMVRYEDFFPTNRKDALICLIAGKLGVQLQDNFKKYLLEKYTIDNIKKNQGEGWANAFNITNDGKSGAWKDDMTPGMVVVSKEFLVPTLIEWGYETDGKWTEQYIKD
jgi:hypothetical protein